MKASFTAASCVPCGTVQVSNRGGPPGALSGIWPNLPPSTPEKTHTVGQRGKTKKKYTHTLQCFWGRPKEIQLTLHQQYLPQGNQLANSAWKVLHNQPYVQILGKKGPHLHVDNIFLGFSIFYISLCLQKPCSLSLFTQQRQHCLVLNTERIFSKTNLGRGEKGGGNKG